MEETITHCSLSLDENWQLREELERKKNRKGSRGLNTMAHILTPLEGRSEWEKVHQAELVKKQAEALKIQEEKHRIAGLRGTKASH